MTDDPITSDNIHLSRPKLNLHGSTVDCTDLSETVAGYVRDSLAENTRRAYQSDLRHFEVWGGSLPAFPETIAAYLAAHADQLSVIDAGPAPRLFIEGAPIARTSKSHSVRASPGDVARHKTTATAYSAASKAFASR